MNRPSSNMLRLTPKIHPVTKELLQRSDFLHELVHGLGSPLNLIFPEMIAENKSRFESVFAKHQILGRVYYAHKANRSSALVKQLSVIPNAYIDVASEKELTHALSMGFSGDRIGATGPKTREFLRLCVQHNVLISIDNVAELDQTIDLAKALDRKVPITLRISDFPSDYAKVLLKDSRFGIPANSVASLLDRLSDVPPVVLQGFAFHIDSTGLIERVAAIEKLIEFIDLAQEKGLNPTTINIGGGYKVDYLISEEEWNNYTTALKEAVLGEREPFTWNNHGFGLWSENRVLKGSLNIYNFCDHHTSDDYLEHIFSHPSSLASQSIGEIIRDRMIEVMIEPGRAMADQCGLTLARVTFVKESPKGETLIGMEMNRADLALLEHEVFIDPILIPQDQPLDQPVSAYLIGNLCLESDLVFIRRINFPQTPRAGDLMAFVNSAGYYSDFSANSAIRQPSAEKVAVSKRGKHFSWTLDSLYHPVAE